jgi:hypothetical protein
MLQVLSFNKTLKYIDYLKIFLNTENKHNFIKTAPFSKSNSKQSLIIRRV